MRGYTAYLLKISSLYSWLRAGHPMNDIDVEILGLLRENIDPNGVCLMQVSEIIKATGLYIEEIENSLQSIQKQGWQILCYPAKDQLYGNTQIIYSSHKNIKGV